MLKKLLKGILWLVALLLVGAFLFVWQGLGVNPLEGDEDHLWDLVSNQVDFFARFPAADLLDEPVVEGLGEEEGFEWIREARDRLAEVTRDVARDVNPQVPLGLFEVNLEEDMKGKEIAIGGIIDPTLRVPPLINFVVLVRIPGYAKFISALQRDFVKSKVQGGDRISVVRGLYFKIQDRKIAEALAPLRSGAARQDPDTLWFARIRDVLLVTDEPLWIEDALRGGADTIPADVDFKTEFIPISVRRGDIDVHVRPRLSQRFYGRPAGGPLDLIARLVPAQVLGNLIAQVRPEDEGVGVKFINYPQSDAFARTPPKPYVTQLYEREKADLRFDYTENGIGRLIPRHGVVGAAVIHADADTFVSLAMDSMSDADRSNLDSLARQGIGGGRAYASYEALLTDISKDLSDTHLLIVHRPAVFDRVDYRGADELLNQNNPSPQPSFSFVSAVRASSDPAKIVDRVTENLRFLGLKPPEGGQGIRHPSGKFFVVDPLTDPGNEFSLLHPAYAALNEGGRFFVFTSSPENMEAILAAATDPEARLLAEPGFAACTSRLLPQGTLSIVIRGHGLRNFFADRVRNAFYLENDILGSLAAKWRKEREQQGITDVKELDDLVDQDKAQFKAVEYPKFKDRYWRRCDMLDAVDTAVLGVALGVGPAKTVTGQGYALARRAVRTRE